MFTMVMSALMEVSQTGLLICKKLALELNTPTTILYYL